jgi:hypothetical protein
VKPVKGTGSIFSSPEQSCFHQQRDPFFAISELFEKYIATKLLATGTIESVNATRACASERFVEPDVTVAVRVVVDQIE